MLKSFVKRSHVSFAKMGFPQKKSFGPARKPSNDSETADIRVMFAVGLPPRARGSQRRRPGAEIRQRRIDGTPQRRQTKNGPGHPLGDPARRSDPRNPEVSRDTERAARSTRSAVPRRGLSAGNEASLGPERPVAFQAPDETPPSATSTPRD